MFSPPVVRFWRFVQVRAWILQVGSVTVLLLGVVSLALWQEVLKLTRHQLPNMVAPAPRCGANRGLQLLVATLSAAVVDDSAEVDHRL